MTSQLTANHRDVLRALADTAVPALPCEADPTGLWAASGSDLGAAPAAGVNALTSLTLALAYCAPDPTTGVNPIWQGFGYDGPPQVNPGGRDPLPTVVPPGPDAVLAADVCVVGSGAGGGLIAGVLAQAGLDVVVLEAGGNYNEADFTGLELPSLQQMFWRGGVTTTTEMNVSMLAGATLGGGPTVNWSNCLRTPAWNSSVSRCKPARSGSWRSSRYPATIPATETPRPG